MDSIQQQKFYLSFENGLHCKDYISEKFWTNGLQRLLVPIVFGPTKEDVQAVAPKNSFIHTEDFSSPRDLVDYINYLDSNLTAYKEYFLWRKELISIPSWVKDCGYDVMMCQACQKINQLRAEGNPKRQVKSVLKGWYIDGMVDDQCTGPLKLPDWVGKIWDS